MGIYDSGSIFGIRIYNFNDDDFANTLFEQKHNERMTHQQMNEAYLFYTGLNDKNEVRFQYYTECCSTMDIHNTEKYRAWYPISLNLFLEKFGS
jgi:hypothetical protein